MSESLHQDIMREAPIELAIYEQLVAGPFNTERLGKNNRQHQKLIGHQLGQVGLALEMSVPTAMDPVEAIHDPVLPEGDTDFVEFYQSIIRSPRQKMTFDNEMVEETLVKLGHTNTLRNTEGFDAGIDLAHMAHLLQGDYERIPERKRRPEMLRVKGLVLEELALLWQPRTPEKLKDKSGQAFMFDLEDPNVFTQEEVDTLSEADRWKRIGIRLSDEAADVFKDIYESLTADLKTRMEAMCRMTDMRIRSLRLQISIPGGPNKKTLYDKIDKLNADYMSELATVWTGEEFRKDPEFKDSDFFEFFVVGEERHKMLEAGLNNQLIRLAMPREDQAHKQVPRIFNNKGVNISLSTDVVVEDVKGRFIRGYQAKAMSKEKYETEIKHERAAAGDVAGIRYMDDRNHPIELRFADDYRGGAIDLSRMLVTRRAA